MPQLIATKDLTYNTRRLFAGDQFEASNRDAIILTAIRKAKRVRAPGKVEAPPAIIAQKIAETVPATPVIEPMHPVATPEAPTADLAEGAPDGIPTPIPNGWKALPNKEIIALATDLAGPFSGGNGKSKIQRARDIISAAESDRASRA